MKKFSFDVTGKLFVYLGISLAIIVMCLLFIAIRGFNLGIDFESGLSLTVKITASDVSIERVRKTCNQRVQQIGNDGDNTFQIRCSVSENGDRKAVENDVKDKLEKAFGADAIEVTESSFIGAKFSTQLITGSIKAVSIALVLILFYVWVRFRAAYAICSILALMHDVICILGFISISRFEITGTTIAAVLTIIGYSLNNTIVIFDRIREEINDDCHRKLEDLINSGVNNSLTRTTYSSITTILAVIPLAILTNADVFVFAVCMIVGIVVGTYSSNFVSTGLLYLFGKTESMDIRKPKKKEEDFEEGDFKILV